MLAVILFYFELCCQQLLIILEVLTDCIRNSYNKMCHFLAVLMFLEYICTVIDRDLENQ